MEVEDAREKAIRAVLEQYKNSNVGINVIHSRNCSSKKQIT
ncbi:MAG: hypothetical protein OIN90_01820 [Candidatus Methanoperedens sp.]|nr:hypothetical protein [Candidatus Methanoperedens sp.]